MKLGLKPSASTITWWLDPARNGKARDVFFDKEAVDLPLALDAFTDWYGARPDSVWGNSAAFDIGLLKDAYKACGKEFPVAFYRERCYRTLKGLPGMDRFKLTRRGTHHNALDDAYSQAGHCRDMLLAMQPKPLLSTKGEPQLSFSGKVWTHVVDGAEVPVVGANQTQSEFPLAEQ